MRVFEITGGVGSGKSEVLKYLEEAFGASVCQLDEVARQMQKRGTECFRRIVEIFGEDIVGADGELDRQKLADIVFSDGAMLRKLDAVVHPAVYEAVRRDIRRKAEEGTALYVIEAALLPKPGQELCEEMWYIYADEDVRRERLKASRRYTDEKITQMMASQPGEDVFRKACSAVVDNSGAFEDTKRQIGEILGL